MSCTRIAVSRLWLPTRSYSRWSLALLNCNSTASAASDATKPISVHQCSSQLRWISTRSERNPPLKKATKTTLDSLVDDTEGKSVGDFENGGQALVEDEEGDRSRTKAWKPPFSSHVSDLGEIEPEDPERESIDVGYEDVINTEREKRRIYVLGTGKRGIFIAHSLASVAEPPPITLMVLKKQDLEEWKGCQRKVSVTKHDFVEQRAGFDIEWIRGFDDRPGRGQTSERYRPFTSDKPKMSMELEALVQQEEERLAQERKRDQAIDRTTYSRGPVIDHLIVTTKGADTVEALRPLLHRLTQNSTICFMQSGIGIIEQVTQALFPDEATRPHYLQALSTHSYWRLAPFHIKYDGVGTFAISQAPMPSEPGRTADLDNIRPWARTTRHLLWHFTRCPLLVAYGITPAAFFQLQLDRLAIDMCIEPLSVIFDCDNGQLLYNPHVMRLIRLLLAEACLVFRNLPELKGRPNVNSRFETARIEQKILFRLNASATQRSSMRKDAMFGRVTEINFLNGWVVKKGEEQGVYCIAHYTVMHIVKGFNRMADTFRYGMMPKPGVQRP